MNRAAAFAAALSGLPGMGPATLVRLLDQRDPESAWQAVRSGRIQPERRPGRVATGSAASGSPGPAGTRSWADAAARVEPQRWWAPVEASGVGVTWRGQPDYPAALVDDPHPPGVLFWRGDLTVLDRPAVALVGTRHATPDGRAVAFELGRDLAAAGLCVVSGLALGIDGAAHRGCLQAVAEGGPGAPAGVAASGVDVPYPRPHAELWEQVVRHGVIVSETLPGRPAQAWRFPSRNRVIAGLVRMVVVVESHLAGGSLITAEAALERGVEVRAVPGPVRSPASAGTNQLLYDGPGPVRCARDVLDALGMIRPDRPRPAPDRLGPAPDRLGSAPDRLGSAPDRRTGPGRPMEPGEAAVLEALGRRPATVGQVMLRSGLDAAAVERGLERLAGTGLVTGDSGWWSRT